MYPFNYYLSIIKKKKSNAYTLTSLRMYMSLWLAMPEISDFFYHVKNQKYGYNKNLELLNGKSFGSYHKPIYRASWVLK